MKKNNSITKENLIKKRLEDSRYLRNGDITAIAKAVGYTKQSVHAFITGKTNSKVIKIVFDEFVETRKNQINASIKENI